MCDCLQWKMDTYFSYQFHLFFCDIHFGSLDAEMHVISIVLSCILEASRYRAELQMIKLALCHGSVVLLADFHLQLKHTHKIFLIKSVICRLALGGRTR